MKKSIYFIIIFMLSFFMMTPILAEENEYIIDQAGLLTQQEINSLDQTAESITSEYNTDIYVRFYNDYDTENIESFAEEVYQEENLGIGSDQNGVLLIVTMQDHSYDIIAHGELANKSFTDYGKQQLADAFLPYLSDGQYYEAVNIFLSTAENYLYDAQYEEEPMDTWIPETNYQEKGEMSASTKTGIIIGIPCLISLIICLFIAGRNKTSRTALQAKNYIAENGVHITGHQDLFLYQTRSVQHIERNSPNNGGGSYGGTSTNSSGFSHSSGHF